MTSATLSHDLALSPRLTVESALTAPPTAGTPAVTIDDLRLLTDGWLDNRRLSPHTRDAYRRDVNHWLDWCAGRGLDPLTARFVHVNAYARELEKTIVPQTGRPPAPTTVARRLSGISSWYDYWVKLGELARNPVQGADRPDVDRDHSGTIGLTTSEVGDLLAAARTDTTPARVRNLAAVTILADLGLRVGELLRLNVEDLLPELGHRTVRFVGKGGRQRRRALPPSSNEALEPYLQARAAAAGIAVDELTGPLFVTASGTRWLACEVFQLVRRLAKRAGIAAWANISPHSLRHAFATTARQAGADLEDVQDAMGHADPRTTRRYDRDRYSLDRDPAYVVSQERARRGKVRSS